MPILAESLLLDRGSEQRSYMGIAVRGVTIASSRGFRAAAFCLLPSPRLGGGRVPLLRLALFASTRRRDRVRPSQPKGWSRGERAGLKLAQPSLANVSLQARGGACSPPALGTRPTRGQVDRSTCPRGSRGSAASFGARLCPAPSWRASIEGQSDRPTVDVGGPLSRPRPARVLRLPEALASPVEADASGGARSVTSFPSGRMPATQLNGGGHRESRTTSLTMLAERLLTETAANGMRFVRRPQLAVIANAR